VQWTVGILPHFQVFFCSQAESTLRPAAANAHRWVAHAGTTSEVKTMSDFLESEKQQQTKFKRNSLYFSDTARTDELVGIRSLSTASAQ
jgi:hypothetical protein